MRKTKSQTRKPAGYSGTPLIRKLGIKSGFRLWLVGAPADYRALLGPLPKGADVAAVEDTGIEFAHVFATTEAELTDRLGDAKRRIAPNGMVWASWPKKASGVETELNGNVVRRIGLDSGLVDIKVCAVDATWSALKFVYRVADRSS